MLKLDTLAEVEALHHNQIQESSTLEYKASPSITNAPGAKTEIAKDASAMANAEGGQIVYGMTEHNHMPDGLDAGIEPTKFDGLWFEQVIQQNVRPQIERLKIAPIQRGNGNIIVIINVPAALTRAPHQLAKDGRYYRRRNFRNDIMEDYEVREAMRRATTPEPFVEIGLPGIRYELQWTEPSTHSVDVELIMLIGNRSREPALYVHVTLYLDASLVITRHGSTHMTDARFDDGSPAKALTFSIVTPHHFPIFREKTFRLGKGTHIAIAPQHREGDRLYRAFYEVSTPGYLHAAAGRFTKIGNTLWLNWEGQATPAGWTISGPR